ncbi:hypothetical protein DV737_g1719, partial [Chaetothyriales sp. CBS 132003]
MPPLSTEEDIAWLKSTFHPIPKVSLPDDSIAYSIYLLSGTIDQNNDSETRLRLRDVQKYAAELQKQWLKDYIWQRQGFSLELRKDNGVSHLRGCVEYGDSIEDEWVIVWLLREITKKFSDAWVKVTDNDGEFLLIEASGTLPSWLEPEVAENRVWINDGQLKIIRPEGRGGSVKKTQEKLSIADARHVILTDGKRLMHSISIEEEAFYRLRNYPGQIKDNMHRALVAIPRKIAFLLKQKPAYISPAIEAFYLRDPVSMKALNSKNHLDKMTFPPTDLVTVSAKFPKVAYAQLKSQEFPVPRVFESSLSPSPNIDVNSCYMSGLKLTCGFEMLLTDTHYQDLPAVREIKLLLEDLDTENETLPTDAEIATWERVQDDEKWLEIDFNDLQRELDGRPGVGDGSKSQAFADKTAQENLRRIVKQFDDFLNDDDAGPDGADMFGDVSEDDLDEDHSVDGETREDEDSSISETELTKLMQELMGMPPEVMEEIMKGELGPGAGKTGSQSVPIRSKQKASRVEELDSSSDEDNDDMEAIMKQMEKELKEKGALNLDPIVDKTSALRKSVKGKEEDEDNDDSDLSDDDSSYNDIDANLVQNLLESFKAQAGAAGPTGNLMGLMGINMPRDGGNSDDEMPGPSKR